MAKTLHYVGIALGIATALSLAACAPLDTTESSMTRVKLYSSVEELSADSALIIIGKVASQRVVRDIDDTPFTISTVEVRRLVKGEMAADYVEVRQFGGAELEPPVALLKSDRAYLLYLTPSGLAAPLDTHYYVTGANAGIFEGDPKAGANPADKFAKFDPEPGEELPVELAVQDAVQSSR